VNGVGPSASFNNPYDVSFSQDGTLIAVADRLNHMIRIITVATGAVVTAAGSGTSGSANGVGANASFAYPMGVSFSHDGTLLAVADTGNDMIRIITVATGAVVTVAGSATLGSADGAGTSASFNGPRGVSFSHDGTLLAVADSPNHMIRMITVATGAVVTVAGSTTSGSADGVGTNASFNNPQGISFSQDGTLVAVADRGNRMIRSITVATGAVVTVAGSTTSGSADGVSSGASYGWPFGVSLSQDGTLIAIADTGNDMIRAVGQCTVPAPCPAGQELDLVAVGGNNGSCDCNRFCASNWASEISNQRPHWTGAICHGAAITSTGQVISCSDTRPRDTPVTCQCKPASFYCAANWALDICSRTCSDQGLPVATDPCVPIPATPAPTPAPQQSYFEVTLPFNVTTASGSRSQFNESAFEQSVKTFLVQQVGISNSATWTQTAVNTTEYPVVRAVSRSTSNFTATAIAESFRQNQATATTQLAAAGVTTTTCRDCFVAIHYIYVLPPVSHHSWYHSRISLELTFAVVCCAGCGLHLRAGTAVLGNIDSDGGDVH
jgi:sugar lactone lactonase YvrE